MFGSWVLEVAIGLIFVFLLFSTICAALREGIEALTKTRGAYLERGLREMLHDLNGSDLAKKFYEHPLIYSLYAGEYAAGAQKIRLLSRGRTLPSYIPSKNFSAAMIDLAARGPLPTLASGSDAADPALSIGKITPESLRAGIANMDNKRVARAMLSALDLAENDLNKTRANLEAWYDSGMDRISGWYKRSTQWIVFGLAFVMAFVLNVDAIGIANFLYQNDNARHAVVAQAEAAVAQVNASTASTQAKEAQTNLDTLSKDLKTDKTLLDKAKNAADKTKQDEQAALAKAHVAQLRAEAARTGTVPAAHDEGVKAETADTSGQKYQLAKSELDGLELPIGWGGGATCPADATTAHCLGARALTLLGWLLTAVAATLGAPFWFDILNRVMVIRSTVKPYEKSEPEASEDRQPGH